MARIEPESGDAGYLFVNYVAVPGRDPAGLRVPPTRRLSAGRAADPSTTSTTSASFPSLSGAVVRYLATFVALYLMAVIIDGLAPTFCRRRTSRAR